MKISSASKWVLFISVALVLTVGGRVFSQSADVRLALVNVPDELLRPLLPEFQKQTRLRAEIVYTGSDPFAFAREGKADLVISHYGHEGVESFVNEGIGLWPHPVFANQMVLLGPRKDPAHVRNLADAAEAFRRIAATKSPFLSNAGAGAKYLEEILWTSAHVQEKGPWYLDPKLEGGKAAREAAAKGAYVLWGLPPFLRLKRQGPIEIEPLVFQDPIFQRIMVSIVVNPKKLSGAHDENAKAFQKFLIEPATQARIRAFRYPDFEFQAWWPAGRHNMAKE
jgi:tungstate transport system substrate-binding protein